MPAMGLRVAFLTAECEPWAKTGGLADVMDALARALGRLTGRHRRTGRRVPAALPGRARARGRGDPRRAGRARAGSARADRRDRGDHHRRRGRRLPTAPGRPPAGLRPGGVLRRRRRRLRRQRVALRAVRSRRARGAPRPTDDRSTSSTSTTGRPDRWRSSGRCATPTTRSSVGPPSSPPSTTSPTTAGPGTRPSPSSGSGLAAASERAPGQNADGIDLLAAAIEGAELVNTVSPGYAGEALTPEFGMGLDGLLRALGDRFIGILNGLDTTVWDPARDADLAAPYSRDRSVRDGGLSGRPADTGRVRRRRTTARSSA